MEPTTFEIKAETYRQKWTAAMNEIQAKDQEIQVLQGECTRLTRENYYLRDQIRILKNSKECLQNTTA